MELSKEKLEIIKLSRSERITLIKACPGSGKTLLFVEKTIDAINELKNSPKGVLALSFSNIAKDEINERLFGKGLTCEFPNFIGTIDSFLQRFIIQPFASSLGYVKKCGVNLIPAECVLRTPGPPPPVIKKFNKCKPLGINQYDYHFNGDSRLYSVTAGNREFKFINDDFCTIKKKKYCWWKESGNMTHNDINFLSWKIMQNHVAKKISEILFGRFEYILIDEAQDTNYFMSSIFSNFISNSEIKVFIVGDSDQAIYEFNGADGSLIDKYSSKFNVEFKTLDCNYRSYQKICDLTRLIAPSKPQMNGIPDSFNHCKLILLEHNLDNDLSQLIDWQSQNLSSYKTHAVLTNKEKTVFKLRGKTDSICLFNSKVLNLLHESCCLFKRGKMGESSEKIRIAFRKLIEKPNDYDSTKLSEKNFVESQNIDYVKWKELALVIASKTISTDETWEKWRERLKLELENILSVFSIKGKIGGKINARVKEKKDKNTTRNISVGTEKNWLPDTVIKTVHKSKGQEFQSVLYYTPKPHDKTNQCPSKYWFCDSNLEWRRVAYVAMTRAQKALIVCLHKKTVENIKKIESNSFIEQFHDHIIL